MFDFTSCRALVVGDVMLDSYWNGSSERISPEAPVPVVHITKEQTFRPGGAANLSCNLAALGAKVTVLGLVGADSQAQTLTQALEHTVVNTQLFACPDHPTITKLRLSSHDQHIARLDFEQDFRTADHGSLHAAYHAALTEIDTVIFSDYGKGTLHHCEPLIAQARAANKTVIVAAASNATATQGFQPYQGAHVLITQQATLCHALGHTALSDSQLQHHASMLRQSLALSTLVVKRGKQGILIIDANHCETITTTASTVFDLTGAGDTVTAVMSLALYAQTDARLAAHWANTAASLAIHQQGTAIISKAALQQALHQQTSVSNAPAAKPKRSPTTKQHTVASLSAELAQIRADGNTVVMTNGCFDILHAGHATYLRKAKALGDYLIVAINSDASLKRQGKAGNRPFFNAAARLNALAALHTVDAVLVFDEDTPEALLKQLKPDILVKGGDYQEHEIVGREIVLSYGGHIAIVTHDYLDYSSSALCTQLETLAPENIAALLSDAL